MNVIIFIKFLEKLSQKLKVLLAFKKNLELLASIRPTCYFMTDFHITKKIGVNNAKIFKCPKKQEFLNTVGFFF